MAKPSIDFCFYMKDTWHCIYFAWDNVMFPECGTSVRNVKQKLTFCLIILTILCPTSESAENFLRTFPELSWKFLKIISKMF